MGRDSRQVQSVNYYDEFEHFNPCFNQYGTNWDNSYTYCWGNQYAYNISSHFYDYQSKFVQFESKPFWKLAIERLPNTLLS